MGTTNGGGYFVRRESYKGHPMLAIYSHADDKRAVIQFGARKAAAIAACTAAIQAFVNDTATPTAAEVAAEEWGSRG